MIKQTVKEVLLKAGYVISAYDFKYDHSAVRMNFLTSMGINLIFDVGANEGQYAGNMRKLGYKGRIVSFEPLTNVFKKLKERSTHESNWVALNCALGSCDETAEINISKNTFSSSLLEILPTHVESAPESVYHGKETICVRTLDSIIDDYYQPSDKLFLKIDTQGFGMKVLQGAEKSMDRILGIHLEMSLVPLYKDEPLMGELATYLHGKGFSLVSIEPEYINPETGQQLQVNGLFLKFKQTAESD
jgi:FkbM family methyltransferase